MKPDTWAATAPGQHWSTDRSPEGEDRTGAMTLSTAKVVWLRLLIPPRVPCLPADDSQPAPGISTTPDPETAPGWPHRAAGRAPIVTGIRAGPVHQLEFSGIADMILQAEIPVPVLPMKMPLSTPEVDDWRTDEQPSPRSPTSDAVHEAVNPRLACLSLIGRGERGVSRYSYQDALPPLGS